MSAHPPLRGRFRTSLLAVLLVALAGTACESISGPDSLTEERERLEQARAQWRAQGLQDYQFTFQRICFCLATGPMTVTVRGGEVVSVESVSDGSPQDVRLFSTIESLFNTLSDAIDEDPAQFRAEYDSGRGYPTSSYIDYDERIADEEFGFTATDLLPLR